MLGKLADSGQTRVEECVQWATHRIDGQVFRPGMRLPSIRRLARERGVSPFTVVEAYERLVASGYLEARRGSGFYVLRRETLPSDSARRQQPRIDLSWLMRNMLADSAAQGPGLGVLPAAWLGSIQLGPALRSLGRQAPGLWLQSGSRRGHEPLRSVLQQRLAAMDILAAPEQIVLTTGITHALDLVLRTFVGPADAVLVLDPCWFGALGLLSARGTRVLEVPCNSSGPDLEVMERLAREEQPRLLIISSAAQNPTGTSLSREAVARIVDIAERHDFLIFEDDVYADLCGSAITRLAAADGLNRVIYAGSFSKTLASNIRVGHLVARADMAESLAVTKIVSGFTTPELNERLVHKLLVEGRYARHVQALRHRLALCRAQTKKALLEAGMQIFGDPADGMFLWVQVHADTDELAVACRDRGLLLAPGSLFSPHQARSTWMRFNVTTPKEAREAFLQCIRTR
ncbi:MAG: PLP-dependent aminotransferase family protein [Steroidobacteraceae bacterium]